MKDVLVAPEKFFCGQLNVTQDGAKKTRPQSFARMYRNGGRSSVWMAKKEMATAAANNFKAKLR